jgi:hypothetical protein
VARFPTPTLTSLLTLRHGASGGFQQRCAALQALLAGRQPPPQQRPAHEIAICQAGSDARGGAYYRKKLAEGKSHKEGLRCLKRRVLRCRLQEPHGGFAGGTFARRRLTKRGREETIFHALA